MTGIPPNTYKHMREVLLDCGPFGDDNQLRSMFAHQKLRPWRHSVPQASNPAARVDATIAFLVEKRRADTEENALVLLLRVLGERLDPGDECHSRLMELAYNLEHGLGYTKPPDQQMSPTQSARDQSFSLNAAVINEIRQLVRDDQLEEALAKLSEIGANQNDVDQLLRRLNRVRKQERQGTLTGDEADAQYARIADAILNLISP